MSKEITPGQLKLQQHINEWCQRLDVMIKFQEIPSGPVLLLPQTPLAMHMLGADLERSLFISNEAFGGVIPALLCSNNEDKHWNISEEILKALPKSLTDPVAVYETFDKNTKLYLTDLFTITGASVFAIVDFDSKLGNGKPITLVTDVMSANDGELNRNEFFENMLTIEYVNREKWSEWQNVCKTV